MNGGDRTNTATKSSSPQSAIVAGSKFFALSRFVTEALVIMTT